MGVVSFVFFAVWGTAVSRFDASSCRIPNALSLPAVIVTWGLSGLSAWWAVPFASGHFFPAAILGGLAWWVVVVGMGVLLGPRARAGAGDAKLAASLGVLVLASGSGAVGWFATVGVAGALGAVTSVLYRQMERVPQGPAMVCATGLVVLCNWLTRAL